MLGGGDGWGNQGPRAEEPKQTGNRQVSLRIALYETLVPLDETTSSQERRGRRDGPRLCQDGPRVPRRMAQGGPRMAFVWLKCGPRLPTIESP